jgi:alpha-beta hydrolase superfamily lysophospholipase
LRAGRKSNPNLPEMQFAWTAPDGDVFPCEKWDPPSPARGVLVCVHGMGGSADEFAPLAAMAAAAGFACYGLNLRGQGHDPQVTRRGHYLHVPAMCSEIAAFAREVTSHHTGRPVFLCGESMGALLVSRAVASRHIAVDGVILSAPVVALQRPTPPPVREALRWAARLLPRMRFQHSWLVSGKKETLPVSRDVEYLKRIRSAPHAIKAFSFHFLNAMGELISSSAEAAREMTVPCLVLAAGHDVFLRADQVETWFREIAASDKTFRLYPDAYHCLWNDWERDAVLRDIAEWLDTRVSARPAAIGA